jgi:hypothetical protein
MIKLIIFDGGKILYTAKRVMKIFEKEYDKFLRNFGVSLKEQEKIWLRFYPKISSGRISLKEANKIVYKKLGILFRKLTNG